MSTIAYKLENIRVPDDFFHSYEFNPNIPIPIVGDTVDFDDDSFFPEDRKYMFGSIFEVIERDIAFSRMEGCEDDFFATLTVRQKRNIDIEQYWEMLRG